LCKVSIGIDNTEKRIAEMTGLMQGVKEMMAELIVHRTKDNGLMEGIGFILQEVDKLDTRELMLQNSLVSFMNGKMNFESFKQHLLEKMMELFATWNQENGRLQMECSNIVVCSLTKLCKKLETDIGNKIQFLMEKKKEQDLDKTLIKAVKEPQRLIMDRLNQILEGLTKNSLQIGEGISELINVERKALAARFEIEEKMLNEKKLAWLKRLEEWKVVYVSKLSDIISKGLQELQKRQDGIVHQASLVEVLFREL
jgi:hypothetical protein